MPGRKRKWTPKRKADGPVTTQLMKFHQQGAQYVWPQLEVRPYAADRRRLFTKKKVLKGTIVPYWGLAIKEATHPQMFHHIEDTEPWCKYAFTTTDPSPNGGSVVILAMHLATNGTLAEPCGDFQGRTIAAFIEEAGEKEKANCEFWDGTVPGHDGVLQFAGVFAVVARDIPANTPLLADYGGKFVRDYGTAEKRWLSRGIATRDRTVEQQVTMYNAWLEHQPVYEGPDNVSLLVKV